MRLSLIFDLVDRLSRPVDAIHRRVDRLAAPARAAAVALGGLGATAGINRLGQALDGVTGRALAVTGAIGGVVGRARAAAVAIGGLGATAGVDRLGQAIGGVVERVRAATGALTDMVSKVALLGGALGAGGFALFKTQFLDTASKFERFKTVLEVTEGSAAKAGTAFDWISDFAARTPYELDQVTDAFVRMRGAGLNATDGLLEAAGNAAASKTKSMADAVEAIADAVTGENERLKEFGITASKEGKKIVYEYAINGQTMRKVADANSRAQIASTLKAIWNQQYGGAMDKLSRTWDGIISNIQDTWTRWTAAVMDAGVFDWLKGRAQGLLDLVNGMAADGTLQDWATRTAGAIISAFEATERFVLGYERIGAGGEVERIPALWDRVASVIDQVMGYVSPLVDTFGAVETAVGAVALLLGGPLLAALASLTAAFVSLGVAIMATPIGWILAAVAALAAAAALVYANWQPMSAWFVDLWTGVQAAFNGFVGWVQGAFGAALSGAIDAVWARVKPVVDTIKAAIDGVMGMAASAMAIKDRVVGAAGSVLGGAKGAVEGVAGFFGAGGDQAGRASAPPIGAAAVPVAGAQRVDAGGTLRIKVDSEGRARVAEARPADRRVDWSLDTGVVMAGP